MLGSEKDSGGNTFASVERILQGRTSLARLLFATALPCGVIEMNRILPCLLTLAAFPLVAAGSGDPPPPQPHNPAATSRHATDDELNLPQPPRKPIVPDPAKLAKALPEEREAVRAAVVGRGGARYNQHGQVGYIESEDATDADVKLFGALPHLEYLHLGPSIQNRIRGYGGQSPITDAGIASLLGARKLRRLSLVNTQVTDEAMKVVGQLTAIESLVLASRNITGAGMAHLDRLQRLETLTLFGSSVGDDGMRHVAKHAALRELYMGRRVTCRGLAELVPLKSLDFLRIFFQPLKDDDLVAIGQMTSITTLRCGFAGVSDEGLRHMTNMTRVRCLNLTDAKATDAGMAYVAQMKGLEILTLNKGIGDAGVAQLATLRNLKQLSLRQTKITDVGLAKLVALPQLRNLDLMYTHVTPAGVAKLRGMKKLERVDLDHTDISDEDAKRLIDSGIPVSKSMETNPFSENDKHGRLDVGRWQGRALS